VAWAMSLAIFPYVAVPLYLVFGRRKFYGYVEARRKGDRRIDHVAENMAEAMRGVRDKEADWILLIETATEKSALDLRGTLTGDASLAQAGATGKPTRGLYQLDFALARTDL